MNETTVFVRLGDSRAVGPFRDYASAREWLQMVGYETYDEGAGAFKVYEAIQPAEYLRTHGAPPAVVR